MCTKNIDFDGFNEIAGILIKVFQSIGFGNVHICISKFIFQTCRNDNVIKRDVEKTDSRLFKLNISNIRFRIFQRRFEWFEFCQDVLADFRFYLILLNKFSLLYFLV